MFAHYDTILSDDDALRIGLHLDRTVNGGRQDRAFVPQGIDPPGAVEEPLAYDSLCPC
jgi:hypothetical protein